ncbi:MAG: hypothetical protein ACOX1Q_08650 [Eubacteriales bacterium]
MSWSQLQDRSITPLSRFGLAEFAAQNLFDIKDLFVENEQVMFGGGGRI